MRKKPTNLTISDAIRARADSLMESQGFSSFSAFVEQLIREEHARHFPEVLHDAAAPPKPLLKPVPVLYSKSKQTARCKRVT